MDWSVADAVALEDSSGDAVALEISSADAVASEKSRRGHQITPAQDIPEI
jgi:hypothetical protein